MIALNLNLVGGVQSRKQRALKIAAVSSYPSFVVPYGRKLIYVA